MSEAQDIVDYDWLVSVPQRATSRLHHVMLPDDLEDVDELAFNDEPIVAACGRKLRCPRIPGVFTRMGAMRCEGCCRAKGLPLGKGSPKNDDACRRILGWDAS